MKFEVKWSSWNEEEDERVNSTKLYASLGAATDCFEHMKNLSHVDQVRIAVVIEEFTR